MSGCQSGKDDFVAQAIGVGIGKPCELVFGERANVHAIRYRLNGSGNHCNHPISIEQSAGDAGVKLRRCPRPAVYADGICRSRRKRFPLFIAEFRQRSAIQGISGWARFHHQLQSGFRQMCQRARIFSQFLPSKGVS